MEELEIVRCTPDVLVALGAAMPSQHHRARFGVQLAGAGVYLVALVADAPAGHALLRWRTTNDALLRLGIAEPYVEALAVAPAHRRRGVATALMRSAEQIARSDGHATIGLHVGVTNAPARALYRGLGYVDAGLGTCEITWSYRDDRGVERTEGEICTYFTRQLMP